MKFMIRAFLIWVFSTLPLLSFGINVSPLIIDFTPTSAHFQDITVVNSSDQTAYVRVKVTRILNAGMPNEKRLELTNNPEEFGLVVSPTRLVIPPQQVRLVRVLPLMKTPDVDAFYEVNVSPASGEMESLISGNNQVTAGVQIIVGYAVKVFIRPALAKAVVTIVRNSNQITITNTGNSNVLLTNGVQCSPDANHCTPLEQNSARRIYPGNTWQFMTPNAAPVQFEERFLDQTKTVISN